MSLNSQLWPLVSHLNRQIAGHSCFGFLGLSFTSALYRCCYSEKGNHRDKNVMRQAVVLSKRFAATWPPGGVKARCWSGLACIKRGHCRQMSSSEDSLVTATNFRPWKAYVSDLIWRTAGGSLFIPFRPGKGMRIKQLRMNPNHACYFHVDIAAVYCNYTGIVLHSWISQQTGTKQMCNIQL